VDVDNFFFLGRGCLSRGAVLYLGEGTGHANHVETPPDTT